MKKKITVLMIMVICINWGLSIKFGVTEAASVSNEICEAIREELSFCENVKSSFGMKDVEFEELYVGQAISVYRYMQGGLTKVANAYPLFEKEQLVILLYELDNLKFQIMPSLANNICESGVDKCAIIYDSEGCHLYDGTRFVTVAYNEEVLEGRKSISLMTQKERTSLLLSDFRNKYYLNYISDTIQNRSQTNYMCNVSYVPQNGYKICWAATIATIVNSVTGRSLTAVNVAKAKYSASDYDHGLSGQNAIAFMNSKYSMAYVYSCGLMPNDGLIISNIQQGYPLYGHAVVYYNLETTNHAVTIYGINAVAGRLMVMDSNFGSTTAYYRQGTTGLGDDTQLHYRYIDPSTNAEIAILHASCRYW